MNVCWCVFFFGPRQGLVSNVLSKNLTHGYIPPKMTKKPTSILCTSSSALATIVGTVGKSDRATRCQIYKIYKVEIMGYILCFNALII